jgi:hypothetical protein
VSEEKIKFIMSYRKDSSLGVIMMHHANATTVKEFVRLCLFVLTLRLAASVLEPEEVKRVNRRNNDILVVA